MRVHCMDSEHLVRLSRTVNIRLGFSYLGREDMKIDEVRLRREQTFDGEDGVRPGCQKTRSLCQSPLAACRSMVRDRDARQDVTQLDLRYENLVF